ncbi:MAG: Dyp-type peroxidase [Burkholderiales bacterium]|nr:Dyp-type peroxidase [Burkholderiales bacterium]
MSVQPGILAPVPPVARHLSFDAIPGGDLRGSLRALQAIADGESAAIGVGLSLARALGREIRGLHDFPVHSGAGFDVPATPGALWCWLRGTDRGELVHLTRRVEAALAPGLRQGAAVEAFRFGSGLDLTGYEDGTENPTGDAAVAAAVVSGQGPGLDGGSFAAVQQWVHDLGAFAAMTPREQDYTIGRRRSDNEEIEDAPASAHVKRAEQESFEPEAFVLRRSMPWVEGARAGLVFVAFGRSVDAFEVQLRRMCGAEDGVADALFRFTRPVTGAYYWCPPLAGGRLDLRALGL